MSIQWNDGLFIAGQRVQYKPGWRKAGCLGVVQDAGLRQTIPSGLTYVRFDGHEKPMIVATDGLDPVAVPA